MLYQPQISSASRRRLARRLVGLPIKDVERDLVLETLPIPRQPHGISSPARRINQNPTEQITEYSANGVDIPHMSGTTMIADSRPSTLPIFLAKLDVLIGLSFEIAATLPQRPDASLEYRRNKHP